MKLSDFYHLPVNPDGACFFNAISGFLHLEKKMKKRKKEIITYEIEKEIWDNESLKLRKKCISWLKKNLDYRIKNIGTTIHDEIINELQFNDINDIEEKTVKGYLKYMNKYKSYAGQIEIYAISELTKKNVRTFISRNGKLSNVGLGYEIKNKNDDDIYLYHNLGDIGNAKGFHHFEILFPKIKAKIVKKSEYNKKVKTVKSLSKKKSTKKLSVKKRRVQKKKKTERRRRK
jgi:hypothetical protein